MSGLSQCCVSGHIHAGTPKGSWQDIGGLRTYVTGEASNKSKTVVFLSDIFGVDLPNVQLLADIWAENGFYVYIPDILQGDSVPIEHINTITPKKRAQEEGGITGAIKTNATAAYDLVPFITKHREAVVKPLIEGFMKAIKGDAETGKITAVGFCFGGRYVFLLGQSTSPVQVDVVVSYHPSLLSVPTDFENLNVPVYVGHGTADNFVTNDEEIENALIQAVGREKLLFERYEDASHGYAVRGDDLNEKERSQKEETAKNAMAFVNKYM